MDTGTRPYGAPVQNCVAPALESSYGEMRSPPSSYLVLCGQKTFRAVKKDLGQGELETVFTRTCREI